MFVYERLAIYEVFFIYLQWEVEGMLDPDARSIWKDILHAVQTFVHHLLGGGARAIGGWSPTGRSFAASGFMSLRSQVREVICLFFRSPRASWFSSSSSFPFTLINTNILLILDITYSCLIKNFPRVRKYLTDSEFNAFARYSKVSK